MRFIFLIFLFFPTTLLAISGVGIDYAFLSKPNPLEEIEKHQHDVHRMLVLVGSKQNLPDLVFPVIEVPDYEKIVQEINRELCKEVIGVGYKSGQELMDGIDEDSAQVVVEVGDIFDSEIKERVDLPQGIEQVMLGQNTNSGSKVGKKSDSGKKTSPKSRKKKTVVSNVDSFFKEYFPFLKKEEYENRLDNVSLAREFLDFLTEDLFNEVKDYLEKRKSYICSDEEMRWFKERFFKMIDHQDFYRYQYLSTVAYKMFLVLRGHSVFGHLTLGKEEAQGKKEAFVFAFYSLGMMLGVEKGDLHDDVYIGDEKLKQDLGFKKKLLLSLLSDLYEGFDCFTLCEKLHLVIRLIFSEGGWILSETVCDRSYVIGDNGLILCVSKDGSKVVRDHGVSAIIRALVYLFGINEEIERVGRRLEDNLKKSKEELGDAFEESVVEVNRLQRSLDAAWVIAEGYRVSDPSRSQQAYNDIEEIENELEKFKSILGVLEIESLVRRFYSMTISLNQNNLSKLVKILEKLCAKGYLSKEDVVVRFAKIVEGLICGGLKDSRIKSEMFK